MSFAKVSTATVRKHALAALIVRDYVNAKRDDAMIELEFAKTTGGHIWAWAKRPKYASRAEVIEALSDEAWDVFPSEYYARDRTRLLNLIKLSSLAGLTMMRLAPDDARVLLHRDFAVGDNR